MPAKPSGAIVTAPLGSVAQHLAALTDRVAKLPGGEQLAQFRAQLAAQLGFDPLTRDGLLSAGVDPDRGAAVALLDARPRPDWVVALPLTKPDLFAQTVQRLLVERFGASPGPQPQTFERAGTNVLRMPASRLPMWFSPISATVSGLRRRAPAKLPPLSSICRNVR